MKAILFIILFSLPHLLAGQNSAEEQAVIATIQQFFDGMRAGDSTLVRSTLDPSARLQTTLTTKEGERKLITGSIERFVNAIGTPHDEVWDELIWSYDINIEDNLATAWTEFTFYRDDILSHCGVNAFHLFRSNRGWLITQITDTRRTENCRAKEAWKK